MWSILLILSLSLSGCIPALALYELTQPPEAETCTEEDNAKGFYCESQPHPSGPLVKVVK